MAKKKSGAKREQQAPARLKAKKLLELSQQSPEQQFPVETSPHQLPQQKGNGTKKKKLGTRQSCDSAQQQQPQQQKHNPHCRTITILGPKRFISSSSASATTLTASETTKKTSLSRQESKQTLKKPAPATRGTQLKSVPKDRKRYSLVDTAPAVNNLPTINPTPSDGNAVRDFPPAMDGRVSSLESVPANKQATTAGPSNKVSSLKSALEVSKQVRAAGKQVPTESKIVRKASVASDIKAARKKSARPQAQEDSLREKKLEDPEEKEANSASSQNDLDSSIKSLSSSKILPAQESNPNTVTNKTLSQNPQMGTMTTLTFKSLGKSPQPQSACSAKSKLKTRSMKLTGFTSAAPLSPNSRSPSKGPRFFDPMELKDSLSTDPSAVSKLERPTPSEASWALSTVSEKEPFNRMERSGYMSTGKPSLRNNLTFHNLEARLQSERSADAGYFNKPTDNAPTTLSSTNHEHMLTPSRVKLGRVSMVLTSKNQSWNQTTRHASACAGDIASITSSRLAPRHSLAPDMLINSSKHQQTAAKYKITKSRSPKFFGNPLVPIDIVEKPKRTSKLNLMHHKDAVQVLNEIRQMKRHQLNVKLDSICRSAALPVDKLTNALSQQEAQTELKCIQLLKTAGTSTSATLSMTGFKGGAIDDQLNHDRSLVVSPFYLRNPCNLTVRRLLMGVFDGHAEKGSQFAEHCQQLLPSLLSRKLSEALKRAEDSIALGVMNEDEVAITKRVLIESFLEMDESAPKEGSGGCTATVVYQQGQKIFVANTGDSRSCIVVCRRNKGNLRPATLPTQDGNGNSESSFGATSNGEASTGKTVRVVYISREDKPDHPEERARLEERGGVIVEAEKNKSARVKFRGTMGKATATLSMSRSIGDSQFTRLGVIPDPIVDVIDLNELLEQERILGSPDPLDGKDESAVDDVCVFAFCASDGIMLESVRDAETVAAELAPSLFNNDGPHPLTACQEVIKKSAATWERRKKGKFRDDITIAVTVLRTPSER